MDRPVYWVPGLFQTRVPYVSRHQASGVVKGSGAPLAVLPGRLSRMNEDAMSACAAENLSFARVVDPAKEESEGIEDTAGGGDWFCQREAVVNGRPAEGRSVRETAVRSVLGVKTDMMGCGRASSIRTLKVK